MPQSRDRLSNRLNKRIMDSVAKPDGGIPSGVTTRSIPEQGVIPRESEGGGATYIQRRPQGFQIPPALKPGQSPRSELETEDAIESEYVRKNFSRGGSVKPKAGKWPVGQKSWRR